MRRYVATQQYQRPHQSIAAANMQYTILLKTVVFTYLRAYEYMKIAVHASQGELTRKARMSMSN